MFDETLLVIGNERLEGGFQQGLWRVSIPDTYSFPFRERLSCPGYRRHLMLLHQILHSSLVLQPMPCWYSKNTCSPPSALALGSALDGLCGSAETPQRVRGMKKGMLSWLSRGTTSHTGNQILCHQRQLMSKLLRLTAASLWEDKRVSQESLSSLSHSLCGLGLVSWGVKRSDEHLR